MPESHLFAFSKVVKREHPLVWRSWLISSCTTKCSTSAHALVLYTLTAILGELFYLSRLRALESFCLVYKAGRVSCQLDGKAL